MTWILLALIGITNAADWQLYSEFKSRSVQGKAGVFSVYLEMTSETEEFIRVKRCGGVFFDQRTILTNAHCAPDDGAEIIAYLDYGYPGGRHQRIKCRSVVKKHLSLDYALIDCPNSSRIRLARVRRGELKVGERVFVVHHNCDQNMSCEQPKKVSQGRVLARIFDVPFIGEVDFEVDEILQSSAFIKPGSSGSPVFDEVGNLVGIANGTSARGEKSSFVPINLILDHIAN